jgi:hypothetical protein
MMKEHEHDLAFLDGGEGVYCMDADCDFRLTDENLLSVLRSVCRVERSSEAGQEIDSRPRCKHGWVLCSVCRR